MSLFVIPIKITKRIRILAAEDDEINYLYIKELLRAPNFELVWARDGLEAVEQFRKGPDFDVVLIDVKMPVMNGYDATVMIKKINAGIPVIAVTAYNRQEDISRATGVNFDGYVVKPIEKNDLMLKIRNVLS